MAIGASKIQGLDWLVAHLPGPSASSAKVDERAPPPPPSLSPFPSQITLISTLRDAVPPQP